MGESGLQAWRSHRAQHWTADDGNHRARPTRHRTVARRSAFGLCFRTMTVIHRSGRCDKRDMKSRRGCRLEPFRSLPPHDHRRQQGNERKPLRSEGEGRQCATMSPDIRNAAPNCYLIARKRRFTVNLSGARPRHWKSEVLSIAVSRLVGLLILSVMFGESESYPN